MADMVTIYAMLSYCQHERAGLSGRPRWPGRPRTL